jgi:hypothetical protein
MSGRAQPWLPSPSPLCRLYRRGSRPRLSYSAGQRRQQDAAQGSGRGIIGRVGGGHQSKPLVGICVPDETANLARRKTAQRLARGFGSRAQPGKQNEIIEACQGLFYELLIVKAGEDRP